MQASTNLIECFSVIFVVGYMASYNDRININQTGEEPIEWDNTCGSLSNVKDRV